MNRIAFVTYETKFAPAGGVAAVVGRLAAAFASAAHREDVLVVTPFHHAIPATAKLADGFTKLLDTEVCWRGETIALTLLRGPESHLFIKAAGPQFFSGAPHPYLVPPAALLTDALLFGVATCACLSKLHPSDQWTLFLQDWQAATVALAATTLTQADRPRCILTLHNSYDHGARDDQLASFGITPLMCPGSTVLSRALPLVEEQVFTVSGQFALDLLEDPLQAQIMASHLTSSLRGRLCGVNNGPFADLAIDETALKAASRGDFEPLQRWKHENRRASLEALAEFDPSIDRPLWGEKQAVLEYAGRGHPLFVMAGRDDSRQKGYDIAALAIRQFFARGGEASFFFFPVPGDEGLRGLQFLKDLAMAPDLNGKVAVFPFRWVEGFSATLKGSSFALMPSLYEPFGMANEFYLNGTIGVGRATGGIVQQIVPLRNAASFSLRAEAIANTWHSASANPTGLLYREAVVAKDQSAGLRAINETEYRLPPESPQRIDVRVTEPLYQAMVRELRMAIEDACAIAVSEPALYFKMLTDGVRFIQDSLSWKRSAGEYLRVAQLQQCPGIDREDSAA